MRRIVSLIVLAALAVCIFAGCSVEDPVVTVDGTPLVIGETTLADLVDAGFKIAYSDGHNIFYYDLADPGVILSGRAYDDEVILTKGEDMVGIMCIVNVSQNAAHALDTVFGGIEMFAYEDCGLEVLVNGVQVYGMAASSAAKALGFDYAQDGAVCEKVFVQGGVSTKYALVQHGGEAVDSIVITADIDAL